MLPIYIFTVHYIYIYIYYWYVPVPWFLSLAGTRGLVGWILHTRCDFIYGVVCVGVLTLANGDGVRTIAYLCKRVCVCV